MQKKGKTLANFEPESFTRAKAQYFLDSQSFFAAAAEPGPHGVALVFGNLI
jgi:hypothetical protein